uniref:Uncharacterized protein n=1 Tax=Knipowitschia caucasica TaxID=637954 RepID=A0AAV2KC32_KNICA
MDHPEPLCGRGMIRSKAVRANELHTQVSIDSAPAHTADALLTPSGFNSSDPQPKGRPRRGAMCGQLHKEDEGGNLLLINKIIDAIQPARTTTTASAEMDG